MITKKFEKLTAYCAVHKGRFDGNDNCPFCAEVRMITTEPKASPVSGEGPQRHEWPVGDQVAKLQSRVAVLEGLLRDYRNSDCEHDGCYSGESLVTGYKYDHRCDVCMRTDSILAPAPLTEGE